ncbi:MAG: hypothetical protein D6803_04525 [Anaerolineae bacterium]|nr:MAG: hypothetical protein D6803_04525 [Anaerolineae bacterium]
MPREWKIRDAAGWTMAVFGAMALLLGALGILFPHLVLRSLNFEIVPRAARASHDYTLTFLLASSMASFNMGVYYLLAVFSDWKAFYGWTVPFRMLTFVVFTTAVLLGYAPGGFLGVGLWELAGAVATGIALRRERTAQVD